jgi:hypothetical protein
VAALNCYVVKRALALAETSRHAPLLAALAALLAALRQVRLNHGLACHGSNHVIDQTMPWIRPCHGPGGEFSASPPHMPTHALRTVMHTAMRIDPQSCL